MNNFWKINWCFIVVIVCTNDFPLLAQVPLNYKGKPFIDGISSFSMQTIPGRMELAFFDDGGEGVAYHDTTVTNDGAVLNHTNGHHRPGITPYVAFFREKEGVDISYTKDWADFNHPNKVDPKVNQLYIGWEEDGEWTNYTVDVLKAGKYRIITVYSNDDNAAELWVDGVPKTKLKLPLSTGNWHYWDQATVGEIIFEKAGQHLITFKYNRGANWAYLDFLLVEEFK